MGRALAWTFGIFALVVIVVIAFVELRNRSGVRKAEAEFAAHQPSRIGDFGTTRTLSILPLIDWHTSAPELRGEMGVSYLIETDEHRILFDVGQNARKESPSPLELNMKALGVALDSKDRTFSVGLEQVPLPSVRAFVPMTSKPWSCTWRIAERSSSWAAGTRPFQSYSSDMTKSSVSRSTASSAVSISRSPRAG